MRFMYLRCRTSGSTALRTIALVLTASLASLPVGEAVVHAQQPIQLFLSAVDNDGKPVTDLKAEEVLIQVDGADCMTTRFEAIDWPTKLTVMVDNSPVFNDALRQLLTDPEPSVRAGAVRGLGLLAEPLDALESMADDPDWWLRSAVDDVSPST